MQATTISCFKQKHAFNWFPFPGAKISLDYILEIYCHDNVQEPHQFGKINNSYHNDRQYVHNMDVPAFDSKVQRFFVMKLATLEQPQFGVDTEEC